jgi:hypothetical protein
MCGWDDRDGFAANLEAAIQFGRNVTWRMQHAFNDVPGFKAWDLERQARMGADPLFRFFNEVRLRITKRAESPIRPRTTVSLEGGMLVFGWNVIEVPPQGPWYRWSWRDLRRAPFRRLRRLRDRGRLHWRLKVESWRARRRGGQTTSQDFYFDDPAWKDQPCRDLVSQYLDRLEAIVNEAESRFGQVG